MYHSEVEIGESQFIWIHHRRPILPKTKNVVFRLLCPLLSRWVFILLHFARQDLEMVVELHFARDLPPATRPTRVRVEPVVQRQPVAGSRGCCADDDDYTPAAIVQSRFVPPVR